MKPVAIALLAGFVMATSMQSAKAEYHYYYLSKNFTLEKIKQKYAGSYAVQTCTPEGWDGAEFKAIGLEFNQAKHASKKIADIKYNLFAGECDLQVVTDEQNMWLQKNHKKIRFNLSDHLVK